ncbi:protein DBF4 homolog A [Melanotaenia boesemani]|uniref:protein DBF4 homolog A n=1 Tax=Melanotaenia boesemani TaxID=1250792 RepID=UPI001C05CC8C|nr:protein DBF4 homolog A [Melanotaenia boesemani]XP_041843787.1 protein DBF4 homolog A [Melanotaenia boesemani]XP_041843788.1 protein DBF4 homolog A [Melanotaenia boesemani]
MIEENKMKPKRHQKHSGPNLQGKSVNTGEKATASQIKQRSLLSSLVRPFAGKVFYLDLPSNKSAETLESDIKELGGTVEKFFSKEIRYLVSNKREAKYVHRLRQDSPVPSPDSGQSSPRPCSNSHSAGNHVDNRKHKSQGQADAFVTSRGKSLVERVVKEQGRIQVDRILSNALEWGVKILYIDDVIAYVQKKKISSSKVSTTAAAKTKVKTDSAAKQGFQKSKGGRISKPFVKVEDSSRHYRPLYLTMPNMPEFNLSTIAPCSPFYLEDKGHPGAKQLGHRGAKASASEEKAQGRKKNRDKKRGGYCECCMIKYDKLTMHLQSERHKAFSKTGEYDVVDRLISTLHCNFITINTEVNRPKCSVSSVLVAPGPCKKTDPSCTGKLDCSQTVQVEDHKTATDGSEGSYLGQKIKIGSIFNTDPLIQVKGDWRNCFTYLDRFKHKPRVCKQTHKQNFLTSSTQNAEHAQLHRLKSETAPSRGEFLPTFPPKGTQLKLVRQVAFQDTNCSTSYSTNIQSEESAKNISCTTHLHEGSSKSALLFDAVQERNAFSEKLPEKEEASLPSQSFSPDRKIWRKIRVYKHKRRKVDRNMEHVKQSVPDATLKLWELFQSSDDMDAEFHGFAD